MEKKAGSFIRMISLCLVGLWGSLLHAQSPEMPFLRRSYDDWLNQKWVKDSHWKGLSVISHSQWGGVGVISLLENCNAFLIHTSNRSSDPAYIVTPAHCLKDVTAGRIVLDVEPKAVGQRMFPLGVFRDNFGQYKYVNVERIAYADRRRTDIAILELRQTIGELKAAGFAFLIPHEKQFTVDRSHTFGLVGMPHYTFAEYVQGIASLKKCRARRVKLNTTVPLVPEMDVLMGLTTFECDGPYGAVGVPMVDFDSRVVYGMVLGQRDKTVVGADLTGVGQCFDSSGRFTLNPPSGSCPLQRVCDGMSADSATCDQSLCEAGDAEACRDIGRVERACELGSPIACHQLASVSEAAAGRGDRAHRARTYEALKRACWRGGYGPACILQAQYLKGKDFRALEPQYAASPTGRDIYQLNLYGRACSLLEAKGCYEAGRILARYRKPLEAKQQYLRGCDIEAKSPCTLP